MNQSKPTKAAVSKTGLAVLGLIVGAVAVAAVLWQKQHPPTWAVSYSAVNHTDKSIVSIAINGEGSVLSPTSSRPTSCKPGTKTNELRPWLHLATLSTDCKVFQDQTPVEVIRAVLADYAFASEVAFSPLQKDFG